MCGICGEYRFGNVGGLDSTGFDRLVEMMARRGPDSDGRWTDGHACQLGFRRLAILDLQPTGDQPMLTADGRFALVFNGELYNFQTLRHELEARGVRFRSTGDTEVVLYALAHWGERALERFNGMFALGFYDRLERTLLLARDHAGIKPLYVLSHRDGLFFASQYNQLLTHPWAGGLPVSDDGLALYLRLGYIPAPYAIMERTFMLEPGTWVRAEASGRQTRGVYYRFPVSSDPDLRGEAAHEAVDAAVTEAVRRQMVSDVPLGAFLSGGIDSPLVAAKMRAITGRSVRAYTIGTAGSHFDESDDAVAYARALGLDHVLEQLTTDRALAWLDDAIEAASEPLADYSLFPTLLVSNLARRDMTVMLSGDGGDELFWGYAERFGSVLRAAGDFTEPYWWRSARWGVKRTLGVGRGHENMRWSAIGDWVREKHSRLSAARLPGVFEGLPRWPADFTLFDYDGADLDQTAQWLRWNEFVGHLTMVLLKVDRASMHNSLEVRVPLLDREVIDVAARIDWRTCLDLASGTGKQPLRQALRRHTAYQTQPKRGFTIPMDAWLRGPLHDVFADMLLGRRELLGMALNQAALEQALRDHVHGTADRGASLWTLLSLAFWHDRQLQPARAQAGAMTPALA